MLSPDLVVQSALDVTPQVLEGHGVRGVLVDMDDTLVPSDAQAFGSGTLEWLAQLRDAGIPVVMLSNGERARVARCCRDLGIEGFHLAGKPFWWAFRRGLRSLGLPAREAAMIGDQIFTDVLGANLAGMVSVLVRPLSAGKLPHTRLARRLERLVLRGGGDGGSVDR